MNFVGAPAVQSAGGEAANAPKTPLDVFAALLDFAQAPGEGLPEGEDLGEAMKTAVATNPDAHAALKALLAGHHGEHGNGEIDPEGCEHKPHESHEAHDAAPAIDDPAVTDFLAVFSELVEALTALDTALEAGEPPDPALLKKVSDSLDALATALGIPIELKADPSQVAEAFAAVASIVAPALAPALETTGDIVEKVAAAHESETPEQKPVAGGLAERLADKLRSFADTLDDPVLSPKLTALADRLTESKLPHDLLAKIGLAAADGDPLLPALTALLAPKPEHKPDTTPKPHLAAPVLDTPEVPAFLPKKEAEAPPPPPAPPAPGAADPSESIPDPVLEPDAKPEIKIAQADRPTPNAHATDKPEAAARSATTQTVAAATTADHAPDTALPPQAVAQHQAAPTVTGVDATTAKAVHAAYQAPQLNLPHFAFEIARQVQAGMSRFQIRLDPPELGRVDVRLDMDAGGNVNARLTVERSETLDLMQRDHRALERALAQAGLDTSKTNLEFSLRQNPFARQDGEGTHQNGNFGGRGGDAPVVAETAPGEPIQYFRGAAAPGGVNIFV